MYWNTAPTSLLTDKNTQIIILKLRLFCLLSDIKQSNKNWFRQFVINMKSWYFAFLCDQVYRLIESVLKFEETLTPLTSVHQLYGRATTFKLRTINLKYQALDITGLGILFIFIQFQFDAQRKYSL